MESELYKKDQFTNQNIPYLFNTEITEYDMKDAGFSITREFKLLPDNVISTLVPMQKEKRKKKMGIMQRDDEEYKKGTKWGFEQARRLFFTANDLEDSDILAIKKDAIFTTKKCKEQQVGKYILFRPKNHYTSFIQLKKDFELYYSPEKIDVKGISEENLKFHDHYLLEFIRKFFEKMENEDEATVLRFLKRFINKYKRRELEVGFYREFNSKSQLVVVSDTIDDIMTKNYDDIKKYLDIRYNYYEVLMKFVQILL